MFWDHSQFMRNTDEWQLAVLEYLMTPLRIKEHHSSPLKLRIIRGILPVKKHGSDSDDYERKQMRRMKQAKYQVGHKLDTILNGI